MTTSDSLDLELDGQVVARLCLDLTVYWRGSMFERRDTLLHFYERSMQEVAAGLRYYETGTMSGARPLRKDSLQMIPKWLSSKPRRDIYMMNLESGARANEPSDSNFFFVADEDDDEPMGAVRLALPIGRGGDPASYISLVRDLIGDLEFESGHASYALNWDPRGDMTTKAMNHMTTVAGRYRGVDMFDLDVTLVALRNAKPAAIKTVGWLTLLGSELEAKAGGSEVFEQVLGVQVISLPRGIIIVAGERPALGDRNRAEQLPEYHEVGRRLEAIRVKEHEMIFGSTTGVSQSTEEWLARFDQ